MSCEQLLNYEVFINKINEFKINKDDGFTLVKPDENNYNIENGKIFIH